MRILLIIFLSLLLGSCLFAQEAEDVVQGNISYITSQNVYVKFPATGDLSPGDTLYLTRDGRQVPVLRVENLSSISCVCVPISGEELAVSMTVFKKKIIPPAILEESLETTPPEGEGIAEVDSADTLETAEKDSRPGQQISGRFAVSSYTNFSNTAGGNSQRMRYTASFNIRNISGTRLSFESYLSFVHDDQHWDEIKENVFNGLKIYSLALRYDFNESTQLVLGRKINPKLSSMGAIDGLQFEKRFGAVSVGVVAGARPDYKDYSFNFNLFQAGAYVGHDYARSGKTMQTSLAFVQQMNAWNTDRRFVYLQHINSLVRNLLFMGTAELDLFENVNDNPSGTFRLSNLYLSLRYRVIRQLSFTVSYNARQNIIYYETYKNIVEQLIEDEMLQGFRFRVHSTPFRNFSLGATVGYRYRKDDPRPSRNVYAYATYSRLPFLKATPTLSFTWLESGYLSGKIYSAGLTKDLVAGKLSGGLGYRYVDYRFENAGSSLAQNMAEVNLMWRILKKLSFSVYYEGTFEKIHSYNRIYVNLTQRL